VAQRRLSPIEAARAQARADLLRVRDAWRRRADADNPAQPIAEPAGEASVPAPMGTPVDLAAPGVADPSIGDYTPTSVDSPGESTSGGGTPNTGDTEVTTPTSTAGPNPGYEATDITPVESPSESDEASDPDPAKTSAKTYAAMRLARLEIEMGLHQGSDLSRAEQIEATMSRQTIEARLATLVEVSEAAPQVAQPARVNTAARVTPSLRSFTGGAAASSGFDEDALFI
jgi:hypothetical protein